MVHPAFAVFKAGAAGGGDGILSVLELTHITPCPIKRTTIASWVAIKTVLVYWIPVIHCQAIRQLVWVA